jgi:hypothetical protein
MTDTHPTVAGLKIRIQNAGHKLYMDNFFFSRLICCGTVRLNQRACHRILERN